MSEASSTPKGPHAQARYYTPNTQIREHAGVKKMTTYMRDVYIGSAEDLISMGIVTNDMLPGRPGMPATSATFRPAGVVRDHKEGCYNVVGHMQVTRRAGGRFEVSIRICKEEEDRRARTLRASMPPRLSQEAVSRKIDAENSLWFDTPEKFRKLLNAVGLHSAMASGERFLFRLSEKDLRKLRDLEAQMQDVIDQATILERPGVKKATQAALAAATCAPFQHMLRRIESSGSDTAELS